MKTFNGKAMEMKMNHGLARTAARGAASQFALRAHPTRPLRGGRIYARLGLEGRERKRGVACADVRLFEYERYPLPREGDDIVGETHGNSRSSDLSV